MDLSLNVFCKQYRESLLPDRVKVTEQMLLNYTNFGRTGFLCFSGLNFGAQATEQDVKTPRSPVNSTTSPFVNPITTRFTTPTFNWLLLLPTWRQFLKTGAPFSTDRRLRCYHILSASKRDSFKEIYVCDRHSMCYLAKITLRGGQVVYTAGCIGRNEGCRKQCDKTVRRGHAKSCSIGCCFGDLCNNGGLALTTSRPITTSLSTRRPKNVKTPRSHVNSTTPPFVNPITTRFTTPNWLLLPTWRQFLKTGAPFSSDRRLRCYHILSASKRDSSKEIHFCDRHSMCYLAKITLRGGQVVYTAGCIGRNEGCQRQCDKTVKRGNAKSCSIGCCFGDLCNDGGQALTTSRPITTNVKTPRSHVNSTTSPFVNPITTRFTTPNWLLLPTWHQFLKTGAPFPTDRRLRCYYILSASKSDSIKKIHVCDHHSLCYLAKITLSGGQVVYTAGCIGRNEGCQWQCIKTVRSGNAKSCSIGCCFGDLCNDGGLAVTTPRPVASSLSTRHLKTDRRLRCYNCFSASKRDCFKEVQVCRALNRYNKCYFGKGTLKGGQVIYTAGCLYAFDGCQKQCDESLRSGKVTRCSIRCCFDNLCNGGGLNASELFNTTTTPTHFSRFPTAGSPFSRFPTGSPFSNDRRLWCYDITSTSKRDVFKRVQVCGRNAMCAFAKTLGGRSPMVLYFGGCIPRNEGCQRQCDDTLKSGLMTRCSIRCCFDNLCNGRWFGLTTSRPFTTRRPESTSHYAIIRVLRKLLIATRNYIQAVKFLTTTTTGKNPSSANKDQFHGKRIHKDKN